MIDGKVNPDYKQSRCDICEGTGWSIEPVADTRMVKS